ncbi:MAG: cytoplasmic protein [Nitriliruptorales bacterium]|nr:cytoplasmic protein [Nitriliruptorales bacterium]
MSSDRGWQAPEDVVVLLDRITLDAYGDDEQLWALRQAFEDNVRLPADAFVVGEPVSVMEIDYDGNSRRGLTATCRRRDGSSYTVAACDVVFAERDEGARYVAAYRKWLGLEPTAPYRSPGHQPSTTRAQQRDLDLNGPVDLVVVTPKTQAARCRILGTEQEITLRSSDVWDMVPGEIVTVRVRKQWRYAGHPYMSGDVQGHRLDIPALGLVPLRLDDEYPWDPAEEYWSEPGDPLPGWTKQIIARSPRPSYEMEQVLPGADPDDPDNDPILEASDLNAADDLEGAHRLLLEALAADLRCLDAYAHLGNFAFDSCPELAIRYYEAGMRIGELSLGKDFDGVLPWGRADNRPFLRCLHGFGLCLWRLGRTEQAASAFERMLWLNPTDNQGIRSLLPQVRAGEPWTDDHED